APPTRRPAKRPAFADALKREDIPEELLEKAGGGDKDKALKELVAIFGEDQHARGEKGCQLYTVAFSPDGKLLACAKATGSILLWDVAAGAERRPLPSPDSRVVRIAFSPDGTLLASAGQVKNGAVVRLWQVATGQLLFTSHTPGVWMAWDVAF